MSVVSVIRKVERVIPSTATPEGAGVIVRRTIGGRKIDTFDPFLLLDEFNTENPDDYIEGFPDHPHRGFETVTYMLDGLMEHKDHKGNHGLLRPGAVQWMTAGRGIIHSEMPKQDKGKMHGFQMWVNLPAKDKMIPPRYQDIQPDKIPVVSLDNGVKVKIMAGEFNGTKGAVTGIATNPLLMDITLPPKTTFNHKIEKDHNSFAYMIEGEATFGREEPIPSKSSCLIVFEQSGDEVEVKTGDSPGRFLLAAARPLNEPVARYGPFVMNTQEEIRQAFVDYSSGKF